MEDQDIQFTEHEGNGRRWTRALSQHVAVDVYDDGEVVLWWAGQRIQTDLKGMDEITETLTSHLKGMVERVN